MDRTTVIKEMYQGYLDAHDLLVAGTLPSDIPELATFSARMDEATVFSFQSLYAGVAPRQATARTGVLTFPPSPSAST